MPAIGKSFANLFSKNSVFVGTVFFGAFAFGIGYDKVTSAFWDSHNAGKQWKDIRANADTAEIGRRGVEAAGQRRNTAKKEIFNLGGAYTIGTVDSSTAVDRLIV